MPRPSVWAGRRPQSPGLASEQDGSEQARGGRQQEVGGRQALRDDSLLLQRDQDRQRQQPIADERRPAPAAPDQRGEQERQPGRRQEIGGEIGAQRAVSCGQWKEEADDDQAVGGPERPAAGPAGQPGDDQGQGAKAKKGGGDQLSSSMLMLALMTRLSCHSSSWRHPLSWNSRASRPPGFHAIRLFSRLQRRHMPTPGYIHRGQAAG